MHHIHAHARVEVRDFRFCHSKVEQHCNVSFDASLQASDFMPASEFHAFFLVLFSQEDCVVLGNEIC